MPPLGGSGLEALTDGGGGGGVPDSPLILQGLGVVGAPELTFIGDLDTGIYSPAADQLGIVAGGVEIARAQNPGGNTEQFIISPGGVQDGPTVPSLGFGDGDTGFTEGADDFLRVTIGGTYRWAWSGDSFLAQTSGAAALRNVVATGTVPSVHPASNDLDTGIGHAAANQCSIIAGGVEAARALNPLAGDAQLLIDPAGTATLANPSLALDADGDTGFWSNTDDVIQVVIGAAQAFFFEGTSFNAAAGTGPALLNEAVSATNPNVVARRSDPDTGIGSGALDQLDLVAGGLSCMAVRETAAARQIGFYTTAPISLQTGVAVTIGAVHAALVALGLITA